MKKSRRIKGKEDVSKQISFGNHLPKERLAETSGNTGHTPDDWSNLVTCANQTTPWNGKQIGVDHPVVGVDWWDAYAHAKWKKALSPLSNNGWAR